MLKETIEIDDEIQLLNELLKLDPIAINSLVDQRIFCNNSIANHPTVQVSSVDQNTTKLGILGVLNGLFGTIQEGPKKGFGLITYQFS
jgi:hypothetical protein